MLIKFASNFFTKCKKTLFCPTYSKLDYDYAKVMIHLRVEFFA